jgi:hypothetical protein
VLRHALAILMLGICGPAAADIVTFRDSERTLSFSYDDGLWQASEQLGPGELIWLERHIPGGEKVARCRLRAKKTAYATKIEGHVHQERENIVSRIMESERKRDPAAPVVDSVLATAGSQEIVELRQYPQDGSADVPSKMAVVGLYTVYRGQEIMFQCGYSSSFRTADGKEPSVETEMWDLMKTLSFGN